MSPQQPSSHSARLTLLISLARPSTASAFAQPSRRLARSAATAWASLARMGRWPSSPAPGGLWPSQWLNPLRHASGPADPIGRPSVCFARRKPPADRRPNPNFISSLPSLSCWRRRRRSSHRTVRTGHRGTEQPWPGRTARMCCSVHRRDRSVTRAFLLSLRAAHLSSCGR